MELSNEGRAKMIARLSIIRGRRIVSAMRAGSLINTFDNLAWERQAEENRFYDERYAMLNDLPFKN